MLNCDSWTQILTVQCLRGAGEVVFIFSLRNLKRKQLHSFQTLAGKGKQEVYMKGNLESSGGNHAGSLAVPSLAYILNNLKHTGSCLLMHYRVIGNRKEAF